MCANTLDDANSPSMTLGAVRLEQRELGLPRAGPTVVRGGVQVTGLRTGSGESRQVPGAGELEADGMGTWGTLRAGLADSGWVRVCSPWGDVPHLKGRSFPHWELLPQLFKDQEFRACLMGPPPTRWVAPGCG